MKKLPPSKTTATAGKAKPSQPAASKPVLSANMAHQIADLYNLDNIENNSMPGAKADSLAEKKASTGVKNTSTAKKPSQVVSKPAAKTSGGDGAVTGAKKTAAAVEKKGGDKPKPPQDSKAGNKRMEEEEMKMDEVPNKGFFSVKGHDNEIILKNTRDPLESKKKIETLTKLVKECPEKLETCGLKKGQSLEKLAEHEIDFYHCLLESTINQNPDLPIFKCHKKDPNYILRKLQAAESAGSNFRDEKFKASSQNAGSDSSLVWRRAKDFLREGPIKVFNEVSPSSIIQGSLGDCYLLSALSVLAENEEFVRRLFITREYQENGMYALWLCEGGKFRLVIVDDYFPCYNESSGPAFSKSKNNELWVLLIEKAYAKIYLSYAHIKVGMSGDAFKDLTGAPSEYIDLKNKEAAFRQMKNAQKEGAALAASSKENQIDKGLVSGHSYGILEVQELKKGDYYIKLSNPWQNTVWRNGLDWKGDVVKALGVSELEANKGIFWMDLGNFEKNFEVVTVSRLHKRYSYSFFKYKHTDKQRFALLKVICLEKTHAYFSIHQKHSRFYRDFGLNYTYSVSRIVLARLSKDATRIEEVIGGDFSTKQSTVFSSIVGDGQYLIFAEVDFKQDICQDFVISVYSQAPVALLKFEEDHFNRASIRKELLSKYIIANPHIAQVSKYETDEDGEIKHYFGEAFGLVYFLYENKTLSTTLYESVQALKVKNITMISEDDKGSKDSSFRIAVGPSEINSVLFRLGEKDAGSHASSFNRKHNLVSGQADEQIIKLALAKGNKKPRNVGKQDKDVILYSLTFNGGIALAYHNNTEKSYSESITFKVLENVEVVLPGKKKGGKTVEVKLAPGEKFLIRLSILDPFEKRSGYSSSYVPV